MGTNVQPWRMTTADLDPRFRARSYSAMSLAEFLAQAKLAEQIVAAASARNPQAKRAAFEMAGQRFNPGAYRHMHGGEG